ncbi:hypothetical protein CA267_013330 [Alteromonas pelagimontana]|uniref:VOC family protein n=1 Tax=Alteromonas pelagimontana TaxID=1858656 RepID=A0A6M4MFL6_9ALTE|nr:YciI family protein [Alteromonas pelagimontana]QJR81678.1 hypothetical protein CA267_013330 [Alteromonas pelagimontana]
MKVMVIVKATPSSEAGTLPSPELMEAMGNFNDKLVKAGVMKLGDGLKPSSTGFRVKFSGDKRTVVRGPFSETSELIAGYWIWEVNNIEEALEWVKQCPKPMPEDSEIEVRPHYEIEDFCDVENFEHIAAKEFASRNEMALQQAQLNSYLFFRGDCEAALNFYVKHLKAKVITKFRFSDAPDPLPEGLLQPGFESKIMHCEFAIGNTRIFASDGCNEAGSFSGFSQSLTVENEETAKNVFAALSEGGEVTMPLTETFWSPLYGQLKDQFGLEWMIMVPGPEMPH